MLFGDRLKMLREDKDLTQKELGTIIGVSDRVIGYYESNDRFPKDENTLKKIADYFNVSVDYLLGRTERKPEINVDMSQAINIGAEDMISIPIVGVVRAGQPILAVENIEGYLPLPKSILSGDKDYFILRVQGDSMNVEFKEGTMLVIEKTSYIENGEIGVIMINGLDATVKKVVINENMITLIPMSTNPEHVPQMYDIVKDKISIGGKVKFAMKAY